MRIPQQVSERVKEAPAQALRAVFSGIGQVLLVADRIKSRAAEPDRARSGPADPAPQSTATTERDETRWRSLDETGNVRLIPGQDTPKAAETPVPETAEAPEVTEVSTAIEVDEVIEPGGVAESIEVIEVDEVIEPSGVAETTPEPIAAPEPAATPEPTAVPEPAAVSEHPATKSDASPETPATSLPVPNYDTLTVPSLRARLRNLDTAQLHTLLDYEKAHAGRADVLTMFERRIAKLESDGA
jgi:hypothetical protein